MGQGGQRVTVQGILNYWKKNNVWILGALVGNITFICIFGFHVLNVTYTDWLLGGGDITQNYLGWCFFRNSDWFFPIGLMDNASYPNTVSVIFTDSVPLFAVFFKLFRAVLPDKFQYFGIWAMLCMGAQGAFGALLLYHYVKKKAEAVVGSLLFAITPVMLGQMSLNLALGAQWLILLSLYLGIYRLEMTKKKYIISWGIAGLLAGSIQLYFVPMCGFILLSFLLADILQRRKCVKNLLAFFAYIGAAIGVIALLGGFSHKHLPDNTLLGQSGFNLNGLLNPQGWSQVLTDLPVYGVNSLEGLAYPGTGILLTLAVGALAWLIHFLYKFFIKKEKEPFSFQWSWEENGIAYLILVVICVFVALSPKAAFGSDLIWNLELPSWLASLWQRIGSSGRFIWPVVFLVILGSVVWMEKRMPWEAIAAVLLVIFGVIQIVDGKWQLMQRQVQFGTDYTYESRLEDERWAEWAADDSLKHMVFVSYMLDDEDLMYSLSIFAAQNGMTVNYFNYSCQTIRSLAAEDLIEEMVHVKEDTLYIYKGTDEGLCINTRMEYEEMDGVIVGTVK